MSLNKKEAKYEVLLLRVQTKRRKQLEGTEKQGAKVGSKVQGLRIFCFTNWKENQHTIEYEP